MGVGQAGAVKDAKPQAPADKSSSPGSVKQFNDALGQSANSKNASSTRAASGTAAHGAGGRPMIVRIDANYRSKSATATLSDGSKVPLTLTQNRLPPGDTQHTLTYGAERGPQDAPIVELEGGSGILWQQPSDYALSPKVMVSIKLDAEESARRRIERLPPYIQDHLKQVSDGNLVSLAEYGEGLVKSGATKADVAPIEIQGHAPPDQDFHFVEAARKGRYSQFPSFDQFKKDLTRQVEAAKEEARTKGLTPPDPFAGAEWKDDPAAAKEKWDKFVFAQYDKAVKDEAAKLRHVGEVASMAQNAWLLMLGGSAAVGIGGAGLAAVGEWAAVPTLLESSTGVNVATWGGQFAKFGLGVSFGSNLINRTKEGIEAGSNPVAVVSTAATDTIGGRAVEKITNKSNLTGKELNLSTGERLAGGFVDVVEGLTNAMGLVELAKPPGVPETPLPRRASADPTAPANDTPTSPTQKQLSPASAGVEDAAGTAGKGTATVGGDTAPTIKRPVDGDVPTGNTPKGGAGDSAAADAAKSPKASGGDTTDTIRLRKPGSGEGPNPPEATTVSGTKTGQTTKNIKNISDGDTVDMPKAGRADAPKVEPGPGSAGGPAPGTNAAAHAPVPTKSVDQIVDAYAQGRSPAAIRNSVAEDGRLMKENYQKELLGNKRDPAIADQFTNTEYQRMAMGEKIYDHYNQPAVGKPEPKISEATLHKQLDKYDGPAVVKDGWHIRMNKSAPGASADAGWLNADKAHPVDRFYVNVKGEHAAEFADYVAGELNRKGIKFQLKVASEIEGYARTDAGVVYSQAKDFKAVRDVVAKYRDLHPEAIAEGSPAFTKPMGKGIAVAEEPLQENLPKVIGGKHSFGTARANVIAEAIMRAPANASAAQVKSLVRDQLQRAGFDPDRPWLAQGSKVDHLDVGDLGVARNSAPNGGAAPGLPFDNTAPQTPVRANPQARPPGQGDPGGNGGASGGAGGGSTGSGGTGGSTADMTTQAAAGQQAERVRNYKGPNFRPDPSQGGSVSIDTVLDSMEKGKLQVVDNAGNGKFHDQVWQDLTGKQGQAPAAYNIGNAVRVDINRLTPEQLQRYVEYVRKQDAAKGPR